LTLTSTALQELASFIGRQCGSGWREEGLAEKVLEEVAKSWKNRNGGVIVDGTNKELQDILKTLEGSMSGGKIVAPGRGGLTRENSLLDNMDNEVANTRLGIRPNMLSREDSNASFGMSGLGVQEDVDEEDETNDPRAWVQVIDAFEQPRLLYNLDKKHFEKYGIPQLLKQMIITDKQQRSFKTVPFTTRSTQNHSLPQPISRHTSTLNAKRSFPNLDCY
jgi:DNA polymerase epsilon subunit 2